MERQVRSWWTVRERYRRAAQVASLLGGAAALGLVLLSLKDAGAGALGSPRFLIGSALLLAAGVLAPRWIVNAAWRRRKIRYTHDWS